MVERGSGLGFLNEAAATIEVIQTGAAQDLDGNEAVEARVAGFVDGAHPAFAQFRDYLVVGEPTANHESCGAQSISAGRTSSNDVHRSR